MLCRVCKKVETQGEAQFCDKCQALLLALQSRLKPKAQAQAESSIDANQAEAKSEAIKDAVDNETTYFLVIKGNFQTLIDSKDIESFGSIERVITSSAQPWFCYAQHDEFNPDYVRELSRSEAIKWR